MIRLLALIGILLQATGLLAQVPVIELVAVSPTGGKVGSEFDFKIASGTRAEEVDALHFSHPGITAEVLTDDPLPFNEERETRFSHFRVKIAADVPPGRHEVRAIGRHGLSNPRAFLVHNVANETNVAPSHTADQPTPLAIDTVAHAKATGAEIDYYKLHVDTGQALRIDLLAVQLDSRMIAQLSLYDSSGKMIQSARGSDELDPHLVIDVHQSDDYLLAVHDAIFRGGDDYAYQLLVRDAKTAKDPIRPITNDKLAAEYADQSKQWYARLVGDYSKLVAQATPIDETSDAKQISLPTKITAEFDSRSDVDVYEFSANEGDTYVIDFVSERLGQPTDARLLIERAEPQTAGDPKWQQVSTADDSQNITDGVMRLQSKDPQVVFKAPKTTTYRMTIRDLDTGESLAKKQRYWIDIRQPSPGFDLIAYPHYPHRDVNQAHQRGTHLFRGAAEAIRVFAVRRDGWTGPIEISIDGLPDGVSCAPATIAANRDQAQLCLIASDAAAKTISTIRIIGKSQINDKETIVTATPATIQWGRGGGREFQRVRQAVDLVIAVSDRDTYPVSIAVGDGKVNEVKKGESLTLPIKLTRREGGKNDCTVRPQDLPPNVAAGEVKIAKDKAEGNLVLKVNPSAVPGTYSLWLQNETKIKLKPNPQALEWAQAYRTKLQKLHDDPANKDKLESINAAIKTADAKVEAAKGSAKDIEPVVFIPSPHFSIRIVE